MDKLSRLMGILFGALLWMCSSPSSEVCAQIKPEWKYEIKKVFESAGKTGEHCRSNWNPINPEQWCSSQWSGQVLDPDGERIYRRDGREVELIVWRQKRTILKKEFRELSCPDAAGNYFSLWVPIPNQPDIVALFCNTLMVIDKSSFTIRRNLMDLAQQDVKRITIHNSFFHLLPFFAVAQNGRWFALAGAQFRLYNTSGWDLVTPFPALYEYTDAILTGDGNLLARKTDDCTLEVRTIPTGEVLSAFSVRGPDGTCGFGRLYPGPRDKHWAGLLNKQCYDRERPQCALAVWNLEDGNLVNYVTFEGEIGVQVLPSNLLFAPDWSWVLSAPGSQPADNKYRQDFLLWHPTTGKLLYEAPRFKMGRLSSDYGLELVDVSSDGKVVLTYQSPETWKGPKLAIWEVNPRAVGSNARITH